ncbi:jacalin-related lectin 2-like [Silene latifolia]|uniref:jacalin-related lectin 2-like n=1 Tax=Silene latifolia TaxID=37657 RepID=UPI003D771B29
MAESISPEHKIIPPTYNIFGELVMSPIFGSPELNGTDFDTVMFGDATNNEYITRLSGMYGRKNIKFGEGVTSLAIETNLATYGPFGTMIPKYSFNSDDTKFNFNFGPERQFGGFHGTSSPDILTSIGVYVKPTADLAAFSKKTDLRIE